MKYIFITGSTRGIGLSLAKKFLSNPEYFLIAHGKRELTDSDIREIFGKDKFERVKYLKIDLSVPDSINDIIFEFPGIDVFINNAGIYEGDSTKQVLDVNLTSAILLLEKIYPLVSKHKGTIININSLAGLYPNFKESVYCATKFGLDGFFKGLQSESHKDGVTVTQYYLGATQTDMAKWRKDYDLLIDPKEVAEIVYNGAQLKSALVISQILKRKNY